MKRLKKHKISNMQNVLGLPINDVEIIISLGIKFRAFLQLKFCGNCEMTFIPEQNNIYI